MTQLCRSSLCAVALAVVMANSVRADVELTYLGAFRALPGNASVYGGGLAFYPAGNSGAGSLFMSRGYGNPSTIYEITIPSPVITTSVSALSTATTIRSFPVNTTPVGLVWRSTDDKLYYSSSAYSSQQMNFRSINRDGTGESAVKLAEAWYEGGYGLTQVPDAWATARTGGKNILTIGTNRGAVFTAVDPWNASVTVNQLWKYGTNPEMTGYDYGDGHYGICWVELDATNKDLVFCGNDLPGPKATIWCMRVSDFENRPQAVPQPYKILSVQDRVFTAANTFSGVAYDTANHILYACEGAWNAPTIIHSWSVAVAGNHPPTTVTDLAASNPTFTSITLNWSAPMDDRGPGGKAAGYDIRYSTSPIATGADFTAATQVPGTPTPAGPGLPEQMVVTGLARGTLYYFAVKSYDVDGLYSDLSNVVSLTTGDDRIPPAQVTDLAASDVRSKQLVLSWTASGDDGMTGTASGYDVRMSGSAITQANFAAATPVPLPQGMAPKAPGQAESLLVTGLTPGATYYFAIKVADEIPNFSTLSNVVNVTMDPLPTAPPAAVSDLGASGSDALSAALTWTAVGDANGNAAISYEIRYSTSTITEANWAGATLVPNVLAAQQAGSTETYTVIGLQPSTGYYFAIKVKDEAANVSAISNVATCITADLGNMPLVTTMSIVEKDGVTTAGYPMTLSMGFAKGDVADHVTVRAAGLVLPTQTDVKVRWGDGSVRHALVSFIIPQLQAGQTQTIEFLAGGTNYNSGWVTKDQLLAGDFEAQMAMTYGSLPATVSARQLLQGLSSVDYWIKGGICTEIIIRDFSKRAFGQLTVSYRVRVYPSVNAIRVSTVVDNTWIDARGNITFDFALSLGRSTPQVVFSKTGFTQWHDARWHKVFWQGASPSNVEIRHNLAYWIKGGFLSNYDPSLVVSGAEITGQYNSWNGSAHDIMTGAGLTKYFPTTGGRPEIGPYPQWASLYLCSMDRRMAEITTGYGDLSGTIPMHFRESDVARSFYGRPISVDDRPTIWTSQVDVGYIQQYIAPADRFPPAIGSLTTDGWEVDLAHQPSLAYVPYLMTGDFYYLEEMHFWACFDLGASNSSYRGGTQCWLIDQIRGNAWAFRNVVDAAVMTPDGMPEKAYLNAKIANNINHWNNMYITGTNYPTIRTYSAGDYSGDSSIDPATCSYASGIWQDDYFTWSFIHAFQMGYPTLDMVHWGGKGVVDRFTAWPGWNRFRAAVYAMPILGKDGSGNPAPYQTWADVNNGFADKVGPTGFGGDGTNPNSYTYAARGVLALVSNIGNGVTAFNWANGMLPVTTCASDPRWAFAAQYKTADINFDGHVNVGDLQALVATWGTHYGDSSYNAAADITADSYINVGDLQLLVVHWGE